MSDQSTIAADVFPWAAPTPEQIAEFEALPAEEQLARVREAVRQGIDSGISEMTMDDIWAEAMKRVNAKAHGPHAL